MAARISQRAGFTLIELATVLVIVSAAASLGVRSVGAMMEQRSAIGGRAAFEAFYSRARLQAIENRGDARFLADAGGDSLWIQMGDSTVASLNLRDKLGVDLQAGATVLQICFDGRGLVESRCNSFTSPIDVMFFRGGYSRRLRVGSLGHVTELD